MKDGTPRKDRKPWMERMLEVYLAEAPPRAGEQKLHGAVAKLAALHMAGVDHRKVGRFAADVYRLVGRERQRVIDDVAKLAPAGEPT